MLTVYRREWHCIAYVPSDVPLRICSLTQSILSMVRSAWLDWGLSGWLITLLQCFDTVGWVIRPAKHRPRSDLNLILPETIGLTCLGCRTWYYYGPCLCQWASFPSDNCWKYL